MRTACWFPILILSVAFSLALYGLQVKSRDPYAGAIVVDFETGRVLYEDHADRRAYPASMIKLMNLYVLMEHIDLGLVYPDDSVEITREVALIGGRQVWLAEGEVSSVEELIYAMMVHSANDAATALAIHCCGSKAAFVDLMNRKARQLGMESTEFHNVHGLPPSSGQQPDVSTARDFAVLARNLLGDYPQVLKYTSVHRRPFRDGNPVILTSPNKLTRSVPGCDGLKTGFFSAAGFSITATAQRSSGRIIAVVIGAKYKRTRNRRAAELLELGFERL